LKNKRDLPERNANTWRAPEKLIVRKVIIDKFPYIHADVITINPETGEKHTFGIPFNREKGMTSYVFDKNKWWPDELPSFKKQRFCDFCKTPLKPTKLFKFPEKGRMQGKCPKCFLTKTFTL